MKTVYDMMTDLTQENIEIKNNHNEFVNDFTFLLKLDSTTREKAFKCLFNVFDNHDSRSVESLVRTVRTLAEMN